MKSPEWLRHLRMRANLTIHFNEEVRDLLTEALSECDAGIPLENQAFSESTDVGCGHFNTNDLPLPSPLALAFDDNKERQFEPPHLLLRIEQAEALIAFLMKQDAVQNHIADRIFNRLEKLEANPPQPFAKQPPN